MLAPSPTQTTVRRQENPGRSRAQLSNPDPRAQQIAAGTSRGEHQAMAEEILAKPAGVTSW
jgi:hypothetical protein